MANGQVYYDAKTGQYYTLVNYAAASDAARRAGQVQFVNQGGFNIPFPMYRQYIGVPTNSSSTSSLFGKNLNAAPRTDFNKLPSLLREGLTAYGTRQVAPAQRPTPAAPPPQFDMSFIQQMLQNRLLSNQPSAQSVQLQPMQSGIATLPIAQGGNT